MNNQDYLAARKQRIEQKLQAVLPSLQEHNSRLHQAMHYAVLNGGKRLRPLLVYAAGECCGADLDQLDAPACAVELIHAYSLVHDDLPAMDNDDWRRGKPSCHKAFDEATAILVGDALQALAFELLAFDPNSVVTLAKASGSMGMVGGQSLEFDTQAMNLEKLEKIQRLKTGALIQASVRLGAIAAGANEQQLLQLDQFASYLGLAYQIQDDICDYNPDEKLFSSITYLGKEQAQQKVEFLYKAALDSIPASHTYLRYLAGYMIKGVMQNYL